MQISIGRRNHVWILAVILLLGLLPFSTLGVREASGSARGLKPHAPILIDGPNAFTAQNGVTVGSGTSSDPYIIQGWSIDASSSNGIVVRDIVNPETTFPPTPPLPVYFVIRNVFVHSETNAFSDIAFYNDSSPPDLICFECPNNIFTGVVANSTLSGNAYAITLNATNNILVSRVTVHDTGIGVNCVNSGFLQIRANRITDSGTGISLSCALTDAFYNTILDSDFGIVTGSVGSLDMEHNYIAGPRGFTLQATAFVLLWNNQIVGSTGLTTRFFQYGIDMIGSFDISVENNTITNNGPSQIASGSAGIKADSPSSAIVGNTISVGNAYGVALYSGSIEVFHNNFLNNTVQAFDATGQNTWDNGYPSGGNFWSDYPGVDNCSGPNQNICPSPDGIGDTPYVFNFNQDRYPLMKPLS